MDLALRLVIAKQKADSSIVECDLLSPAGMLNHQMLILNWLARVAVSVLPTDFKTVILFCGSENFCRNLVARQVKRLQ